MNLKYGASCKIKHLKPGDFFLRGRWLYKMAEDCKARRYVMVTERKVEPHTLGERAVDPDSEVTLVYLPETCKVLG